MPRCRGLDGVGVVNRRGGLARDGEHLGLGEGAYGLQDVHDGIAEGLDVLGAVALDDALAHAYKLPGDGEIAALLQVVEARGGGGHHGTEDGRRLGEELFRLLLTLDQVGHLLAQGVEAGLDAGEPFGGEGGAGVHRQLHFPAMSMR
jgi:hypothetical protein